MRQRIRREAASHTRGTRVRRVLFAQLAVLALVIGAFATLVTAASASEDGIQVPCTNENQIDVSSAGRYRIVAVCKDGPATATAGSAIQYTLTVYAGHPEEAAGTNGYYGHTYMITDELPAGVTYQSVVAPDVWDCSFSDPTLTCTASDVHSSDINGGIIIINATIDPGYDPATSGDTITNCGTIEKVYNHDDAVAQGYTSWKSCVDTTITREADVSIVKTSEATSVIVPNNIEYTVTASNAGPSNSDPVTFTDTLPAGTTLVSTVDGPSSAWNCDASTATVLSCTTTTGLAVDESQSLVVTLSVPESQAGNDLTNCATLDTTDTVNVSTGVDPSCYTIAGENVTVKAAEAVTGLKPRFTG